jgi:hypothetical protein
VLPTKKSQIFDERANEMEWALDWETDPDAVTTANGELHHSSVLREIENYLDSRLHIHFKDDPLVWWRDNRFQSPRIAVAARKWLSVRGTSTSSDRVFSHCGVGLIAKRATMRGDALMKQVLLKNNLKHVNLSMEDIKMALLEGTVIFLSVVQAISSSALWQWLWQFGRQPKVNLAGCRTANTTLAVDTSNHSWKAKRQL